MTEAKTYCPRCTTPLTQQPEAGKHTYTCLTCEGIGKLTREELEVRTLEAEEALRRSLRQLDALAQDHEFSARDASYWGTRDGGLVAQVHDRIAERARQIASDIRTWCTSLRSEP